MANEKIVELGRGKISIFFKVEHENMVKFEKLLNQKFLTPIYNIENKFNSIISDNSSLGRINFKNENSILHSSLFNQLINKKETIEEKENLILELIKSLNITDIKSIFKILVKSKHKFLNESGGVLKTTSNEDILNELEILKEDLYKLLNPRGGNKDIKYQVIERILHNNEHFCYKELKTLLNYKKLNTLYCSHDEKNTIKLNDLYLLKYFKNNSEYLENYVVYSFLIESDVEHEITIDFEHQKLSALADKFNLINEIEYEYNEEDDDDLCLPTDTSIYAKYIEYFNNNELDSKRFYYLMDLNLKIEHLQKNYLDNNKSANYDLYINKNKNIALEVKFKRDFNEDVKIAPFGLALAYKNIYEKTSIELSEKTINYNDDYENLIKFAQNIAQFDASYYFKNPTKFVIYESFKDMFELEEKQNELNNSLDRLINFINMIHNKKESERLEKERIDKENQIRINKERRLDDIKRKEAEKDLEILKRNKIVDIKEKLNEEIFRLKDDIGDVDDDKNKKWSIIIGTIATIFTVTGGVVGGIDAFSNHLLITITSVVIILSSILFGVFRIDKRAKADIQKYNNEIKKFKTQQDESIQKINSLSTDIDVTKFSIDT